MHPAPSASITTLPSINLLLLSSQQARYTIIESHPSSSCSDKNTQQLPIASYIHPPPHYHTTTLPRTTLHLLSSLPHHKQRLSRPSIPSKKRSLPGINSALLQSFQGYTYNANKHHPPFPALPLTLKQSRTQPAVAQALATSQKRRARRKTKQER
jgi:hypothetical protein